MVQYYEVGNGRVKETLHIYTRVSTRTQEDDGTSIDYQLKSGNGISKKIGFTPSIYNEGGKTSWNSNINTRPELVRILNEIESKNKGKYLVEGSISSHSRYD